MRRYTYEKINANVALRFCDLVGVFKIFASQGCRLLDDSFPRSECGPVWMVQTSRKLLHPCFDIGLLEIFFSIVFQVFSFRKVGKIDGF
jgi:hypothetical protein